jgi:GDP-L-fucose synthase
MIDKQAKVYVAGHRGLAGSAIVRNLESKGFTNLIFRTRSELDLTDQHATDQFFREERPEFVLLAAAKVGGILANATYPGSFINDNLSIQTNVIEAARQHSAKKLVFLGSSCVYPRDCPQPIREDYLLSGPLEPSNRAYAVAKIAGIEMCQSYSRQYEVDYIAVMPTNLYGPEDNFELATSHVLPALIRKFHEAKILSENSSVRPQVLLWGTGNPKREFLHVDDMADAVVYLMQNYDGEEMVNIGTGLDVSIRELAEMIRRVVDVDAEIVLDPSKPDGTPRKLLDVSRLHDLGWKHQIDLEDGIRQVYTWYRDALAAGMPPSGRK